VRTLSYDCLIVDDEEALSSATAEYFNMFDVATAWVPSARRCLEFLAKNEVKLILLDINLGGSTGFQLCKQLRETTDVPILFISARGSDDDILLALAVGGDDYIRKPYSLSVLLAKANALLRRYNATAPMTPPASLAQEDAQGTQFRDPHAPRAAASLNDRAFGGGHSGRGVRESEVRRTAIGGFELDFETQTLAGPDGEVSLTAMEYRLLAYLARRRGRTLSKAELFRGVWGTEFVGDGTLNVHVRRLRIKLGDGDGEPRLIKTVWGVGYRMTDDTA
jgi:two-component system response regulator RegX3